MNQDFYQRERQVRQHDERQRAQAEKHVTLETWQIEQEAAQQGTAKATEEHTQVKQSLLGRIKKALRL